MAKTPQAEALISIFFADQYLKKLAKKQTAAAREVMVDASGRFLYVTTDGNQVVKFVIDAEDGSLGTSSTATAGTSPRGVAGTRNDF